MDLLNLGPTSWEYSQALYHAAAHLEREVLILLRPASPYICIGFHQDARSEIDLDYASAHAIPVFRREVGGGAVFLDGNQLFFQLILRRGRPGVPERVADFFRVYLAPVVQAFRAAGIPAEYKPVNDILAGGRKISGTGAAEIEGMYVLVGNVLEDFDYETMTHVLKVPDEKFRDKVYKTMTENLTTVRREIDRLPAGFAWTDELIRQFEPLIGPFESKTLDQGLTTKADELLREMNTPDYLFANDRRKDDGRVVRIAGDVSVIQKSLKTPGGLIRATAVRNRDRLSEIHLSGDFFFFPANGLSELEKELEGVPVTLDGLREKVADFYERHQVETPGVQPADIAQALSGE